MRARRVPLLVWLSAVVAACGSRGGGFSAPDASIAAGADGGSDSPSLVADGASDVVSFGDDSTVSQKEVASIAITPGQVTIIAPNGTPAQQQYAVTATFSDGTSGPLGATPNWSADQPAIGTIGADGLYTAVGTLGGTVTITATFGTLKATATLLVKLHYVQNPGGASSSIQQALQGATAPDATVKWAYPYDQTVFPRGINESTLMWIGGAHTDFYYIHVTAPTFELESYATAPNQYWDFTTTAWQQFLNTTSGVAELQVNRWNGATASVLVDEHLIVANGSMRGTIYYSAYSQTTGGGELGKVVRIKPGSTAFDDFLDAGTTCTSCHTVSANGGTLVYNYGYWPPEVSDSFDLKAGAGVFTGLQNNSGGDAGASQWALAGLTPDGTLLTENFAPVRGTIGVQTGAFDPATGNAIPGTGISGQLWMPAFSPDGLLLAYVDSTTHDLHAMRLGSGWQEGLERSRHSCVGA